MEQVSVQVIASDFLQWRLAKSVRYHLSLPVAVPVALRAAMHAALNLLLNSEQAKEPLAILIASPQHKETLSAFEVLHANGCAELLSMSPTETRWRLTETGRNSVVPALEFMV